MARQHHSPDAVNRPSGLWPLRLPVAVLLLMGSWPQGVHGERSATAPSDRRSAMRLQLQHHGSLVPGSAADSRVDDTAEAGPTGSSVQAGTAGKPKSHFAHVDAWMAKNKHRVANWHDQVQGPVNDKAYVALTKSEDYMKTAPEMHNYLNGMEESVKDLQGASRKMHEKDLNELSTELTKAKGPAAPYIPDTFPVARPGEKVQAGDDWKAPPDIEDVQAENARLKGQIKSLKDHESPLSEQHAHQGSNSAEEPAASSAEQAAEEPAASSAEQADTSDQSMAG